MTIFVRNPRSPSPLANASRDRVTATATSVPRSLSDRYGKALEIDSRDWGVVVGDSAAAATNVAAINAAMSYVAGLGGGTLLLPPGVIYTNAPLDNCYNRVLVKGAGRDANHDVVAQLLGTLILPTAAVTALRHRTPSGDTNTRKNIGGGFVGLSVQGTTATRGLHVTSVSRGQYDVFVNECQGTEAFLFDCLVTGSTLGEAADNQNFTLRAGFRLTPAYGSSSCDGVKFAGSSNANTCIANDIQIDARVHDGVALRMFNCDNVTVRRLVCHATGSGRPFYVHGTNAGAGSYTDDNRIGTEIFTATSAGYVEGTDTSGTTTAGFVALFDLDRANSTPRPALGTGALYALIDSDALVKGFMFEQLAVGDSVANTAAARAGLGTETVRIVNGSNNHVVLSDADGTNKWGLNIDSGGDLRVSRISGSGSVSLPAAGSIKIGGQAVSLGAADSGGSGYRLLRVENA